MATRMSRCRESPTLPPFWSFNSKARDEREINEKEKERPFFSSDNGTIKSTYAWCCFCFHQATRITGSVRLFFFFPYCPKSAELSLLFCFFSFRLTSVKACIGQLRSRIISLKLEKAVITNCILYSAFELKGPQDGIGNLGRVLFH